ncbi:hypothetical protein [Photobacterium sanguinicancri]|uniref:hypothetical protein n=1 Tax=Photobacterium sanguinicancri TaxID=875932 RepID=UPI001EFC4D57|nr:hypothetical protein [Photobacterium sanguinicancri]
MSQEVVELKNDKVVKASNDKEDKTLPESDPFVVVKKGKSPKLSPKSKDFLFYEIALHEDEKELYIRIAGNSGSGLHSKLWCKLEDIFTLLDQQKDKTMKSGILKTVMSGGSSNNSGFMSAILRTLSILEPVPDNVFLHRHSKVYEQVKADLRALATKSVSCN